MPPCWADDTRHRSDGVLWSEAGTAPSAAEEPGFGPPVDEGAVALGDPQHAIAGDVPCGGP